jgi:hypothetical protein
MRKFIFRYIKGIPTIMEVECEKLLPGEDLSILDLTPGRYKARITAPQSLYEKNLNGELEAPVWYEFAFSDSEEEVRARIERDVRFQIIRAKGKRKAKEPGLVVEATEEEILEVVNKIQVVKLDGV